MEYNFYGDAYVVQRNRVINILGNKFISLGENKKDLISTIELINPDIIHFEEIPETFVDTNILNWIYRKNRTYFICETCHSSQIDPGIKTHRPDKFIMVSPWIQKKFEILGVPVDVLEYPIENNIPDKDLALSSLQLSLQSKHVINVGLFTPGKNQGELIEYARCLARFPIQFHFIGNHADNFSEYWSPLLSDLPPNCFVWGERHDVDLFYQAADLFVFNSTMELNPLCVKESLSWNLPILLRNLDTYSGIYNNNPIVDFLGDDHRLNIFKILERLDFVKSQHLKINN